MNRLNRESCLRSGYMGVWQWTRDGKRVACINLRGQPHSLLLTYRVRIGGGDWEDVFESVPIAQIACRYGGTRPYFECPGVVNGRVCGRRVAKLYGGGRYFLCRHCYRLAYGSQSEGELDRALRRANRIKQRLGGEPGLAYPFPGRPRGMWRRTYERLHNQVFEIETRAEQAMDILTAKVAARINRSSSKRSFRK